MALLNYVKFLRGTQTAYDNLHQKDDNTLYFIYNANDSSVGSLYLGSRLISANVGGSSSISIDDLSDTLITEAQTGDFLILNSEGKWINASVDQVVEMISSAINGTFISDIDENIFNLSSIGKLEVKGYSTATVGMVPIKGQNSLEWSQMPPDLSSNVEDLNIAISKIQQDLSQVDAKILNANHLKYQVIQNLDEAINNNIIYLYRNNNDLNTNDIYNEFMIVNGNLEKIGSFAPDLTNYVTTIDLNNAINNLTSNISNDYVLKTTFQSVVGPLDLSQYNDLGENANITDNIKDIYERLVWQDISL